MIGGDGDGPSKSTSEIVDLSGVVPGPDLGRDLWQHCSTNWNSSHVIIVFRKVTWIVDLSNNFAWTNGPYLTYKREYFGCTTFLHPNGTSFVIVAGSYSEGKDTTEIFSPEINMNSWFEGKYSMF